MKRKRKFFATLILTLLLILVTGVSVSAATDSGNVKLTRITAVDYNKINIKWKKTSGATNYIVYYRKSGVSKWTKIKTLDNTKSSYTHTSSSKYPIVVGQKYQYTVKAYNKNTKKSGSYNTKGLTITAALKMVDNINAKVDGTTVKITWDKVNGADKYVIYGKSQGKWYKMLTVKNVSEYVDVNPSVDCYNYYTVKAYDSSSKTYGIMNNTGTKVYVKDVSYVEPTETPAKPGDDDDDDDDNDTDNMTTEQRIQEVFRLTNLERTKIGLKPYIYDNRIEQAAMVRAKEISIKFSHTRPDGTTFSTAVSAAGVGNPSGENIAMGTSSPAIVVQAWMNSAGHKAAILSGHNTHIGIGYYNGYWVQDFSDGPDEKAIFTIDANGGRFEDGSTTQRLIFPFGQRYININSYASVPALEGYKFDGWRTSGGRKFTTVSATGDYTIKAAWIKQ